MKHAPTVIIALALTFFATQIIGLLIVQQYIDIEATQKTGVVQWEHLPDVGGVRIERPDIPEQRAPWYIFVAILIGTIALLLLIRIRSVVLIKAWFFLAIMITLFIALGAVMPGSFAAVLGFLLAAMRMWRPTLLVHNFTELLIYGGLAAIFVPILNIFAAGVLLILLSIYDMYAVWKSKHMIKMATFQAKSGIFAGLVFPTQLKDFTATKARAPKRARGAKSIRLAVLGGGDMGFPLLFAGAVMTSMGFGKAILVPLVATVALFLLLYLGKKGRFYPAMPFLTIGCAVGYGIALLV